MDLELLPVKTLLRKDSTLPHQTATIYATISNQKQNSHLMILAYL